MSTSLDHFSRGLAKAFARRAKQQTKHHVQHIQKVDSEAATITNNGNATTNTTTKLSNEQYRMSIIQKMLTLIAKQKDKTQ